MEDYTVSPNDFYKETYWTLECPRCRQIIEIWDSPNYQETIQCPDCDAVIKII